MPRRALRGSGLLSGLRHELRGGRACRAAGTAHSPRLPSAMSAIFDAGSGSRDRRTLRFFPLEVGAAGGGSPTLARPTSTGAVFPVVAVPLEREEAGRSRQAERRAIRDRGSSPCLPARRRRLLRGCRMSPHHPDESSSHGKRRDGPVGPGCRLPLPAARTGRAWNSRPIMGQPTDRGMWRRGETALGKGEARWISCFFPEALRLGRGAVRRPPDREWPGRADPRLSERFVECE